MMGRPGPPHQRHRVGQGDRPHAKSKPSRTLKTMERCGVVRYLTGLSSP